MVGKFRIVTLFFTVSVMITFLSSHYFRNNFFSTEANYSIQTGSILAAYTLGGNSDTCENSLQGKFVVCDSRGFVCPLIELNQTNGCCNVLVDDSNDIEHYDGGQLSGKKVTEKAYHGQNLKPTIQYDCSNCLSASNCCDEYENCISCCLKPANLQKNLPLYSTLPILKPRFAEDSGVIKQHNYFDYCRHVCRTGSLSVQVENSYRGFHSYCFSLKSAPIEKLPVNSDWAAFKDMKGNVS